MVGRPRPRGRDASASRESGILSNLFQERDNQVSWKIRLRRFLLDLDARIDFGLYQAKTWGRELYERFTVLMDRFHASVSRRWDLVHPGSECLTLANAGRLITLALPT